MTLTRPSPTRGGPAVGLAAGAVARGADRLLDVLLAVFGGWTLVYDVCLVAHLGTGWAALGGAVAALPAGWIAWRAGGPDVVDETPAAALAAPRSARLWTVAVLVVVALGVAAGVLFGLTGAPYPLVWALWLAAGIGAIAVAGRWWPRATAPRRVGWPEIAVVAGWAVGLALLSLVLLDPDADDAFYVHLSTWIGAHGAFPLRDVVFSDRVFPALYFPPVGAYEPLVGTVSRLTGLAVPDLTYSVVPPAATVLAVLALWRLLRAWRVPMAWLALSTALVFLLFDAAHHLTYGSFFVSRIWQGKTLLLWIGAPLLLALLHRYAARPTAWRTGMLFLAGTACVGLSTSAIFLVPVIAIGAMAAVALSTPWRAFAGAAAAIAYPVGAGVVTKLTGGRTPDVYTASEVLPVNLTHYVLGTGGFAVIALGACLVGPALVPRALAGRMAAGSVLAAGILLAPPVPEQLFDFTGLGRVLWRLTWAMPAAALAGALAVCLVSRGPRLLRAAPAVALCAAMILFGEPLWWDVVGNGVPTHPVLKRARSELVPARRVLAQARPGDLILARRGLSQTLLILSGDVTTVSPRLFFTRALADQPDMHVPARLSLQHFVRFGLRHVPATRPEVRKLDANLRLVGVDIVCQPRSHVAARRALGTLGWRPIVRSRLTTCARAPGA